MLLIGAGRLSSLAHGQLRARKVVGNKDAKEALDAVNPGSRLIAEVLLDEYPGGMRGYHRR